MLFKMKVLVRISPKGSASYASDERSALSTKDDEMFENESSIMADMAFWKIYSLPLK